MGCLHMHIRKLFFAKYFLINFHPYTRADALWGIPIIGRNNPQIFRSKMLLRDALRARGWDVPDKLIRLSDMRDYLAQKLRPGGERHA